MRQIIYSLYSEKAVTEKVSNTIMNSIKLSKKTEWRLYL